MAYNPHETWHAVEDEWHYPRMQQYGFVPEGPREAQGFVRHYIYARDGIRIKCCVGYHGDYWEVLEGPPPTGFSHWHAGLEPYLKSLEIAHDNETFTTVAKWLAEENR